MWIDEHIYVIDTNWGGYKEAIASYLIKGEKNFALIDTGYGATTQKIINDIKNAGLDLSNLKYIILTHTHLDHMGGAGLILKENPKAKVVLTEPGIINIVRPLRMYYGAKMIFGEDLQVDFGHVASIPRDRMVLVEDGDVLELDDLRLRIIETPGHTRDHISIFEETTKTLFTGDAVCNKYPGFNALIPPASPPLYPVKTVVDSIKRLRSLGAERLFIPHFGQVEEDINSFMVENINAIQDWKEYIISNLMKGYSYIDLVEMIKKKLVKESQIEHGEIPKYVKEVVLPILVRVSVLGYMATYINRFPPET